MNYKSVVRRLSVYYENNEHREFCPADNNADSKNTHDEKLLSGLLGSIDRDMLLTASVFLLMLRNGGDMRLVLALGYIMLGGKDENLS